MSKQEASLNPPPIQEHHVRVGDQLAGIFRADRAHAMGVTGKGIRIAVIDSGFYPHPFYVSRGYSIRYIATRKEKLPYVDKYGHGTAQLASLFSIAPQAEVCAIKCMDRDPTMAIEKALSLRPRILSCAWGFNIDEPGVSELPEEYEALHRLFLKAVRMGITVVAAAGNGQYAFPGSMPEVLSVGGVFYSPQGRFEQSDVSSKYESSIFKSRQVPDICGVTGNRPHGRLLLVPVPPKAKLAKRPSFSTIAAGDVRETDAAGWAMFSGTSAATAMLSGAAALLLQLKPGLTPEQIKQLLVESATVVPESGCRVLNMGAAIERLGPAVTSGDRPGGRA
jgi:serine protease AprX